MIRPLDILRKKKALNEKDLCNLIDISRPTLWNWTNKKGCPNHKLERKRPVYIKEEVFNWMKSQDFLDEKCCVLRMNKIMD